MKLENLKVFGEFLQQLFIRVIIASVIRSSFDDYHIHDTN